MNAPPDRESVSAKGDVTTLLHLIAEGDTEAERELMSRVYVELHRLAVRRLRTERQGHTLQATALVNEAYLRMCKSEDLQFADRSHFFRRAAQTMRRILVDYARRTGAGKRNPGSPLVPLDEAIAISPENSCDAIRIDELLNQLAGFSPRQAQVVEMKFYGGLVEEEIAEALGVHARTVRRDWLMARAWLHEQLTNSR